MSTVTHNKRRVVIATLAGLGLVTAGIVGFRTSTAQPHRNGAPQAMPVMVASVVESDVASWDSFSGRLEAVERVDVRSRVAGAVQSVHFTEGALARRGDLLVTIDPAPYAAEVERAEAQVAAARSRVQHTKSEHERARRLWEEKAIAQRELDERVNAAREAEANLRAAEATLSSARLNLSYTEVRAPVSGRVGRLEVTVGNLVAAGPGAPVLTTIVSVHPIYAAFDVDEHVAADALKDLPPGATARGRLEAIPVEISTGTSGGEPLRGRLQLVDNQVNARSGTVRVRAVVDNVDGRLIPGQFAEVKLGRARTRSALLINERAVGTDQSKKFVMVVGPDNKATYREVTLGPSVEGLRVVTSGLQPNERIVVNGLQRVRPGALVAPQEMKMAVTPAKAGA